MPTCGTAIDLCRDFSFKLYHCGQCNIFNEHIFISVCKSYFNMLEVSARILCSLKRQHFDSTNFVTDLMKNILKSCSLFLHVELF